MSYAASDVAAALSGPGKAASRRKGSGYIAPCPVHEDGRPSLSLSDGNRGLIWHCHAGCSQADVGAAIHSIMGGYGAPVQRNAAPAKVAVEAPWTFAPVPHDEAELISNRTFQHFKLGIPSAHWLYLNEAGEIITVVCRYDTSEGKEIVPWSWARKGDGQLKWQMKALPTDRPLFNLPKLLGSPAAPVLYVEGEKAARAAERLFPSWVVTSHQGGADALTKANLAPLEGRHVIVWPDADGPGEKMAAALCRSLDGVASRVDRLIFPTTWPNGQPYYIDRGHDAADAVEHGWTIGHLRQSREGGHRFCQPLDFAQPFGDPDRAMPWTITVGSDGAALASGSVRLEIDCASWRAIAPDAERHFNRRLADAGFSAGRFPRWSGRADLAEHLGEELAVLIDLCGTRPDAFDHWSRLSFFRRRKLARQIIEETSNHKPEGIAA